MAVIFTLAIAAYIAGRPEVNITDEGALRMAAFNVVSILSGTGYGTHDFGLWGPFASSLFILFMFLGGTAGSASCGMKTFRVHVSLLALRSYALSMIRPNRVAPVRYAGKIVREEFFYPATG